jgi:asparagine synthase (glutamine-hydrolysing)
MCGFAGILDTDPQLANHAMTELVGRMADALRARGPDDSGAWADAEAGIALGFRRLAILDLSAAGHQPMVSASGRHVIVFNGARSIISRRCARSSRQRMASRSHRDQ